VAKQACHSERQRRIIVREAAVRTRTLADDDSSQAQNDTAGYPLRKLNASKCLFSVSVRESDKLSASLTCNMSSSIRKSVFWIVHFRSLWTALTFAESTATLRGRRPPVKLIIAIVQDEDTDTLTDALISAGFRFTKISTTGSFLRTGNSSLMIGVEDEGVQGVLAILQRTCRRRTQIAVPYSPALEPGLLYMPENFEVEVGGAVVFVANVSRFERI
jgi:uncharacterized protein YaaQ